jgi:hypothetical protein
MNKEKSMILRALTKYAISKGFRVNYYIPNKYCNWGKRF